MESIFWIRELEDSCFGGEARRLLLISWTMNIGISRVQWLIKWSQESTTREGRLKLCWQLLRCSERDSSIWLLLWAGVLPIGDGYSKLVDKWNSICHLEPICKNIIFEECYKALQTDMRGYSIFGKAICCALEEKICKSSWAELSKSEPVDMKKDIDEWNMLDIRHGRIYEIPRNCLYGMSWRGLGGDTTDEINEDNILEKAPFWKRELLLYKDETWISDDLKEKFYEINFPSDIPDEWSLHEKSKSHGPSKSCGGNYYKWWSSWVCKDHILIWGKPVYRIESYMKEQKIDDSVIDRLCNLYKERVPRTVTKFKKNWVLEVQ